MSSNFSSTRFDSTHYATSTGRHNYSRHFTNPVVSGAGRSPITHYPLSSSASGNLSNSRLNNGYNSATTYGSSYETPTTRSSILATRGYVSDVNRRQLPMSVSRYSAASTANNNSEPICKLKTPPPSYTEATAPMVDSTNNTTSTVEVSTRSAAIGNSSQRSRRGRIGLGNLGNTCYMNSIVQCLSHTRPLLELALADDNGKATLPLDGRISGPFRRLMRELWSTESLTSCVRPSELRASMGRYAARFAGYGQQDAEEFLRYLLEALHEDSNRIAGPVAPIHRRDSKPKLPAINYEELDKLSDADKSAKLWQRYLSVENSPIVDIFVGQLKSTLECSHCGHKSTTFDPFWDLALPIPRHGGSTTLRNCLELFTSRETLDGDEKPTCEKCKVRRRCEKSFSLSRLPRILVLHLVRFSGERYRTKLNTLVDYPIDLDLASFVDRDCQAQASAVSTRYSLYAVSEHSGTPYGGHYTATVRHAYDRTKWLSCNDSQVLASTPEAAVSSQGYVLFYESVGDCSLPQREP